MVQDSCDLCGERYKGRPYARAPSYGILKCARCGLLWTSPLMDGYVETAPLFEVYAANAEYQKQRFREQIKLCLRRAGISDPSRLRVLEVGSGLGLFLDVCEEFGIAAEGCDILESVVRHANRIRERVRLGTLDDSYPGNTFDAVFALNLIEHLPHPGEFLAQARRVLKLGGILVLETPIQESLFHRAARVGYLSTAGWLNFNSYGMRPSRHIYKFSKKTLRLHSEDCGFANLYQRNVASPWREIWGNSAILKTRQKWLYRLSLPVLYLPAAITGQGNRVFVILQKMSGARDLERPAPVEARETHSVGRPS